MSEENKIDLRSEEFQEVLGSVPHWILRWGITILAIVVTILLAGSMIFKYPDVISARFVLTGSIPPASVVAKSGGKLNELYFQDNDIVKAGEYLGVIENTANTKDIQTLKTYLKNINLYTDSLITLPPRYLELGNLQSSYSSLYMSLFEYHEFNRLKYLSEKSNILVKRIKQYEDQLDNLKDQRIITLKQQDITRAKYSRDSVLHHKGVISREELEMATKELLQGQLTMQSINSSIDNAYIQIGQMQESLFDNNYQNMDKRSNLLTQLGTLISQLLTDIQTWEQTYVLISPIDGIITFTNYWTVNQNVIAGDDIFNVIPNHEIKYIGKANLPIARSGKVEVGQGVNIRFDNFPDQEYGILKGEIKNISLVPVRSGNAEPEYVLEVELVNQLTTTYKKELPYLPEMTGQADIITKDISVLERFVMPLRQILNEGMQ